MKPPNCPICGISESIPSPDHDHDANFRPPASGEPSTEAGFGLVLYSNFFQSRIVVVRYESDDHWWFVMENHPHAIMKAKTRLSEMPRQQDLTE